MDNRKIVLISYIACAIIVWFLCHSGLQFAYSKFYVVRRLPGAEILREAIPVLLGALTFFILYSVKKIDVFMDDVVAELKKVTWPTREDVVRSTTVVLICILIASGILAVFDFMWGKVIGFLLKS